MNSSIVQCLLKITTVPVLALGILGAGCDHGSGSADGKRPSAAASTPAPAVADASEAKGTEVAIDNFTFNPPALTVPVGTTVTWVNHDDVPHTVTAKDKGFASTALDTNDKFTHAFTAPGTYPYFCSVHTHMTGQVIVK